MNGYRSVAAPYFDGDDAISPTSLDSPPWGGSSTGISNNLDSIIFRSRAEPAPTERSAALFRQLPAEVIEG